MQLAWAVWQSGRGSRMRCPMTRNIYGRSDHAPDTMLAYVDCFMSLPGLPLRLRLAAAASQ